MDKPKCSGEWIPDEWYKRSEEFYQMVYKGGECRYCHKVIATPLDHCECAGMIEARERFKRLINHIKIPAEIPRKPIDYNPDQFHEQEDFL